MDEPKDLDSRLGTIRREATEFLERLRKVDPKLLVELAIEMRVDESDARFKLAIKEDGLPPLPFDKSAFDKAPPFKDAPFKDTPWHDRVRPPAEGISPVVSTRRAVPKGRTKR